MPQSLSLRRFVPTTPLLAASSLVAALWAGSGGSRGSATGTSTHGTGGRGTGGGGQGAEGLGGGIGTTGTGQNQLASVAFEPAAVTLKLDGTNPQMGAFTLKATYTGGATDVVTPESVQFDRPD